MESGSKNFRGGVADLRRENEVVRQYACNDLRKRCHVHILDLYTERLPKEAKDRCFLFYSNQNFFHGQRKTLVLCCTGRQKYTKLPCERCMQGSGIERQIKSFAEGNRYYLNVSKRCFGESYTSSHWTQIIRCPSNLRMCLLMSSVQ